MPPRPTVTAAAAPVPKGEHIFPNTRLTEIVLQWKEYTAAGDPRAFDLLEDVIVLSTPMFERLAQFEGYHHFVPLPRLVQAARVMVPNWLRACTVEKLHQKKLFSWMSTCAKNAFRSEVAKERQYSTRFFATSDTLEKFVGEEDHAVDQHDAAATAISRIKEISVRWGDPYQLGSVRYAIECLTDETRKSDKAKIISGMAYGYGLSPDMAKFFYQWSLFALRDALADQVHVPFTKQDALRCRETYTFIPDMIDIVGWDRFQSLVVRLGGTRIKLPTVVQLAKIHEEYQMTDELTKTDGTPDEVDKVAAKYKMSGKTAADIYAEMVVEKNNQRIGEHPLYPGDDAI